MITVTKTKKIFWYLRKKPSMQPHDTLEDYRLKLKKIVYIKLGPKSGGTMPKIDKKYAQDFEKVKRDWERLMASPNSETLNMLMKDIQQFQNDLRNIKL